MYVYVYIYIYIYTQIVTKQQTQHTANGSRQSQELGKIQGSNSGPSPILRGFAPVAGLTGLAPVAGFKGFAPVAVSTLFAPVPGFTGVDSLPPEIQPVTGNVALPTWPLPCLIQPLATKLLQSQIITAVHMAHFQLGSFLIGLVSNQLGSIRIPVLPKDLPN